MNQRTNICHDDCLLTIDDITAASRAIKGAGADPLTRFPILKTIISHHCTGLALQMAADGASEDLATRAAEYAYQITTLAAISMHRAIWNAVLPEEGIGLDSD